MTEVSIASSKTSGVTQPSSGFPFEKASHETKVQWEYRKRFLDHYHGQYPDDQLECWSKIISNAKFYGCSYNKSVMDQLNELLPAMGEERIMPRS